MTYKIIIIDEKYLLRDLEKIPKNLQKRILWKISDLSIQGVAHAQVKHLVNYDVADYRIRIGDYRILFNFFPEDWEIHIISIKHRKDAY